MKKRAPNGSVPRYCDPGYKSSYQKLKDEVARLRGRLNTPEINDFVKAVVLEAAHQREWWGTKHDQGKSPEDWLWLIAYLATKAAQAIRYGDHDKHLHHIITTAAACANWHAYASGKNKEMKPGAPTPAETATNG